MPFDGAYPVDPYVARAGGHKRNRKRAKMARASRRANRRKK